LALPTEGTEFGLLPTITASFGERGGNLNTQSNHDTEKAMRIAIPKFMGLLPTPLAGMKDQVNTEAYDQRMQRLIEKGHKPFTMPLDQMAIRGMLPTPTCQDAKQKENSPSQQHKINELSIAVAGGSNSHLNPRFVAEMMGFPPNWTELPFQSGEQNQSRATETP